MKLLQRMFGKTKPDPKVTSKPKKAKLSLPKAEPAPSPADTATAALLTNIEAKRASDPMIGVKVCATEMLNRLILAMRDRRGVQAESMLCALGALGGFACQMAARAQGQALEARVVGKHKYFFGHAINAPLAESAHSLLALTMGAAQALGVSKGPDVPEIIEHTIKTMGANTFGIPRVPKNHKARDLPENYARALWPALLPTIKVFCKDPAEWPMVFGYAAQQVMAQSKDALPPFIAVQIVMEAAVPMSKLDPGPDVAELT